MRRVVYRDAEHLDALVAAVLAATPASEPPADAIADVAELPIVPSSPTHVGRGPFVDALPIEDRLAILTETRLHILDGIGPELWRQADDVSLAELGDRVRRRLGEPPAGVDIARAIDDAVTAPDGWTSNVSALGRVDDGTLEHLYATTPCVVAPALASPYPHFLATHHIQYCRYVASLKRTRLYACT